MFKVYTGGTFDTPHPGHWYFFEQCKRLSNKGMVVVSLNTDEFIEEYKGKAPIMSYEEREAMLKGCKWVDYVIPNTGGADSKPAILEVDPDIIAIGEDWANKDYYKQMQFTQEWLNEHGYLLVYLPHLKDLSSTKIKERIRQ